MQRNTFVARSKLGAYRAIGVAGAPAYQSSSQIFDVLERRLSLQHRQLFAEPVTEENLSDIDWWTDLGGPVLPFHDMMPEEQAELLSEIQQLFEEIRETANSLIAANTGDSARIGDLLITAMNSPAPIGLFAVGGRPVITLWAHEPQTNQMVPIAAEAVEQPQSPPRTPPPPPPPPEDAQFTAVEDPLSRRRWFGIPLWLRWLIPLLLLLLLLFLLRSCVPWDFGLGDISMPAFDTDSLEPEAATPDRRDTESGSSAPEGPLPEQADVGMPTGVDPSGEVGKSGETVPPSAQLVVPSGDGQAIVPMQNGGGVLVVKEQELSDERNRERELRRRIAILEAQIAAKQSECTPEICGESDPSTPSQPTLTLPGQDAAIEDGSALQPPVAVSPPLPPPNNVQEDASPDPLKSEELPKLEPLQQPETPPVEQPRTTPPPPEQTAECPQQRPPWEAPEVVIVFDTSGSMAIDTSANDKLVEPLLRRAQTGDRDAIRQLEAMEGAVGHRRIDAARQSLLSMIDGLPSDVDVGFIEFGSCDSVVNHEFYSAANRNALKTLIRSLKPQQGTPLARALQRAGNIIKGRTTEEKGVVVLVSDGYGSCGGDACAVARQIAAQKPGVTINVVTLGDNSEARCIAEAAHGRVIDGRSMDLPDAIVQASQQAPVPEQCR